MSAMDSRFSADHQKHTLWARLFKRGRDKGPKGGGSVGGYLKRTWMLYLMLVLPAAFFIIFRYIPMTFMWAAFSDFTIFEPRLFDNAWVGLDNFRHAFTQHDFLPAVRNTLLLNFLDLILGFPMPIILAILLNELKFRKFKRFTQTVLYMPHFISWVVVSGMAVQLLATHFGLINLFLGTNIPFMTNGNHWVFSYVMMGIWKSAGWGTIIYLAAIAGINQELYEAAEVDGANRFQKIIHVTIPCIMPTMVILLILTMGSMMGIEFDRPWVLRNPAVADQADVLSTFIYRRGILNFQYSMTAAVGAFQSGINVILLVTANMIAKKAGERGIW
ncbi:MAG: ABC transporter permease subunit [Defluviitaleaceae bacterium]|nr:ABC transporter permease subunit [Defluviitaleaceae bacterium]